MQNKEGQEISEAIRRKAQEFKNVCKGVDEATASRAPAGRWSPKEIVSHVSGPDGVGFLPGFKDIVEKDTPRLDIDVENPFFSERRAAMSFSGLLAEFESEYDRIAEFVASMSDDQLKRKAHIPMLKEYLGEYPTLATWAQTIGLEHLGMHIDHMKEILQAL